MMLSNSPSGINNRVSINMTKTTQGTQLSNRFQEALLYAAKLHARQRRKRSNIPYLAHLLAVTALVLEDGGDEDEAIAALLHDAVEDQGGLKTLKEIDQKFGARVAHIVLEVSDSTEDPKPAWRERKEQYLASLSSASPSAIRVSLADKVHNARTI
jgi:(p)ppGpp synthase/HD superfamily hydrolase